MIALEYHSSKPFQVFLTWMRWAADQVVEYFCDGIFPDACLVH